LLAGARPWEVCASWNRRASMSSQPRPTVGRGMCACPSLSHVPSLSACACLSQIRLLSASAAPLARLVASDLIARLRLDAAEQTLRMAMPVGEAVERQCNNFVKVTHGRTDVPARCSAGCRSACT
jgi:hypothetical protein